MKKYPARACFYIVLNKVIANKGLFAEQKNLMELYGGEQLSDDDVVGEHNEHSVWINIKK